MYLSSEQGSTAASEFQKILDHSGIVENCWTGVLAHLGLARAYALEARTWQGPMPTPPAAAYKDFLTTGADPDSSKG